MAVANSWIDNVGFTPTAGGTADWTYSTALALYQSPALAGAVNAAVYVVRAFDAATGQWEISSGAYASGTGIFSRTTVLYNSAGTGTAPGQTGAGTKINFTNVPQVVVVASKFDLLSMAENNGFTAAQRVQGRANLGAAINELQNVSFAITAAAGALTIALKDAAGNDATASTPIALSFRNASLTASPNVPTTIEVTAATSVVVPSTSTCGFSNATAGRLWIIGWNDGGTFRLGVFNASAVVALAAGATIYPLPGAGIASSLQVVAAGNAAGQHYTAGAAVTSKAYRVLGYVDWNSSGVATAGTWTTTNLNSITTYGPGVPLPGTVISSAVALCAFVLTTSATMVVSGITKAIAPTNAANPIKIEWASDSYIGAAATMLCKLQRGATAIGGFRNHINPAAAPLVTNISDSTYDLPNTTASTTYAVYFQITGGVSTYLPFNNANITLSEIMG